MQLNDSIEGIVNWNGPSVQGDDTLQTAVRQMADHNVSGLLVRQAGNVLGVITDWDISIAWTAATTLLQPRYLNS